MDETTDSRDRLSEGPTTDASGELERSVDLLSSVLESPQGLVIFSLDREYCYTAFNSNHRSTMNTIWDVDIEVGLNMLDAIGNTEDRRKAKENFDRALAGDQFTRVEAYGKPPARFYYEDSYNPIHNRAGNVNGLTVFLTDVTERLKREEELQRYRSGLESLVEERTRDLRLARDRLEREIEERERTEALLLRSQRLEALGTLAGGVAHDFNNILTTVVGYADLLLADLPNAEKASEYLGKIKTSSRHGSSLTSRLLAFSRRQILQSTLIDVSEVVAQMADLFHHVLPEDIRVETYLDSSSTLMRADRGQIEQVVLNLVLNSRDAMPRGGPLTIRTWVDDDGWIRLTVEDGGTGMPAEVLEQIFDPFFTTKDSGNGSGLGLSMVYGIIDQHGGSLDVESQVGEGTRFEIKLPAARELKAGSVPIPATADPLSSNGTRGVILLVEDDDAIRTMARLLLERRGFNVLAADSSQQAVELFENHAGRIDLLFSDVVLPDRDGVVLAQDLLRRQPGLPVLLTSGYSESRVKAEDLLELPSYRFLSKPYYPKSVIESIDELLAGPTEAAEN